MALYRASAWSPAEAVASRDHEVRRDVASWHVSTPAHVPAGRDNDDEEWAPTGFCDHGPKGDSNYRRVAEAKHRRQAQRYAARKEEERRRERARRHRRERGRGRGRRRRSLLEEFARALDAFLTNLCR